MKLVFLSDVHGDFSYLRNVVDKFMCPVIQVGDLGIGFQGYPWPESWSKNFFFIRGNHDNPEPCRKHENYLGDYGYKKEWNLFYVSGSSSIDRFVRTAGIDWWAEEQLGQEELDAAVLKYEEVSPKILVAHTAPHSMYDKLGVRYPLIDRTSQALQTMIDRHPPEIFICGHFHFPAKFRNGGTKVVALDVKQVYLLDTDTLKGEMILI